MPRGLDHVVHAVRDLDHAGDCYRRLGFTVGARNRHPWGTHNRIVQLPGCFVELLAIGEPEKIEQPRSDQPFAFGAFNRAFLQNGEGLSMLALESANAVEDRQAFQAAGIGGFDLFRFERAGRRADGTVVELGFSIAFARDPDAEDVGYFVCQQHHPDNFWDRALQAHANTASAIAAVVTVTENPAHHEAFFSAFAGERKHAVSATGVTVPTPRGRIEIMDPRAFQIQFGREPPDIRRGARLAAIRFKVEDPRELQAQLDASGIPATEHIGRLIVGPASTHGAILAFELNRPS
jgi:hypothetical protein